MDCVELWQFLLRKRHGRKACCLCYFCAGCGWESRTTNIRCSGWGPTWPSWLLCSNISKNVHVCNTLSCKLQDEGCVRWPGWLCSPPDVKIVCEATRFLKRTTIKTSLTWPLESRTRNHVTGMCLLDQKVSASGCSAAGQDWKIMYSPCCPTVTSIFL